MIAEIAETDATGAIADIYEEVRTLYATPYVSSIHRHLATRPGVLEWVWRAVRPVFLDGSAQHVGWRIAAEVALPPLPTMPAASLAAWGVRETEIAAVRAACDSFIRAAPINLMLGGLTRALLKEPHAGGQRVGTEAPGPWSPPPPLPTPPRLLADSALDRTTQAALALFGSGEGERAFVPGLYRMLAAWPGLLAHLGVVLVPRLTSPEATQAARHLLAAVDAAIPDLLARLPAPPEGAPDAAEARHIDAMIEGYRKTSPELVIAGRLIREALPAG
jgi:hypothetical protein